MEFKPGLVFYDLEWTGSEILQIGAVCLGETFERTILTKKDIHYKVSEKIFLQTRLGPGLTRGVFDVKREEFLTCHQPMEAVQQFLAWLKSIKEASGEVNLISHGSLDIPILYQSFAQFNLNSEFLETCSNFVNFQDYLKEYFPGIPLGLNDLVKLCCETEVYRLHSARDDARATQDVFFKLHQQKLDWNCNTSLLLVDKARFGSEFAPLKKIRLSFVTFEKGAKELNFICQRINPMSLPQMVENIEEWSNILATLPLFAKVDPPPCFMFYLGGWVTRHFLEEDEIEEVRTVVELLCSLGKSYVKLHFYPDSKATFKKRKLLLDLPNVTCVSPGTPVTARIKLKISKEARVMYIKEGLEDEGSLVEAISNLGG